MDKIQSVDKEKEALKLWQEWFKFYGDCKEYPDGFPSCFFCGSDNFYINSDIIMHKNDCVFMRAKRLIENG